MNKTLAKILTIIIMCFLILMIGKKQVNATDLSDFEKLQQKVIPADSNFKKEILNLYEYNNGNKRGKTNVTKKESDENKKIISEIEKNFVEKLRDAHIFINDEEELWNILKSKDGKAFVLSEAQILRYKNLLCQRQDMPYNSVNFYENSGYADVYVYDDDPNETAQIADEDKITFHPGNEPRPRSN